MFADSASPMSSSSPSASSAPSIARPRSRCRPPGGPTSTSSVARSSPRVGRLPRCPSSPRAAVAVDATIVVTRREGRNRRAWLLTRRRCRAARATNRPAAMRSARPISIPSATGTSRTPPPPHRRRSPSDPPPDRCRDHRDGPGAWSEGGGGYFYFVLFVCLAGGIWLLARSRDINFPTTIITIVVVMNSYVL
jgi:hypothetical protein